MSVLRSIVNVVPPIHPDGTKFIALFAVAAVALGFVAQPLFWIGLALTVWCALFFRDPIRVTPVAREWVIAPADGRVSNIAVVPPPPELGLGDEPRLRVCIFMNVFDCHVNRSPVKGRIRRIVYTPGKFFNAELDKASEFNERNGLVVDMADGTSVGVVQIAGLVARRILGFCREGDELSAGDRFGLIRFGSRVDVYLPQGTVARVAVGQRTYAGETVIADLESRVPMPVVRVG